MLVRRLEDAPVEEWHRLRPPVLMDAGELGSRNLSVTWLSLPAGAEQTLGSHQEAEQAYVVVRGAGTMSVAGDTQPGGGGPCSSSRRRPSTRSPTTARRTSPSSRSSRRPSPPPSCTATSSPRSPAMTETMTSEIEA